MILYNHLGKVVVGLGIVATALVVVQAYYKAKDAQEMAAQNCVQTQEMRTVSTTLTSISTNGDMIITPAQKIEFKYTCNDYPRWR